VRSPAKGEVPKSTRKSLVTPLPFEVEPSVPEPQDAKTTTAARHPTWNVMRREPVRTDRRVDRVEGSFAYNRERAMAMAY
jgi:hypothetical protein